MCKGAGIVRLKIFLVVGAIASLVPQGTAANAEMCSEALGPFTAGSFDRYTGDDPRVREIDVEGLRVVVLLPPGYDASRERYPVIYLHAGGAHTPDANFLNNTDLIAFTADPDTPKAIVVMPDRWTGAPWIDWRDGSYADETF